MGLSVLLSAAALMSSCAIDGEAPIAAGLDAGEDAACAACHAEEAHDARAFRRHRDLPGGSGCLGCHLLHETGEGADKPTLESTLRVRCEDCHTEALAQFHLPFRHPLGGEIEKRCTICHPPHGGSPRELREHLRHDACVECHLEEAGPFLFEHEGDRSLQCLSCHEPHGSSNPRLLTHNDSRSLCHSCHMNLEDVHREDPGSIFHECLQCHTEVHGSNWDREFFR
jgi:DmsE family decaheme c-type cytochrome